MHVILLYWGAPQNEAESGASMRVQAEPNEPKELDSGVRSERCSGPLHAGVRYVGARLGENGLAGSGAQR